MTKFKSADGTIHDGVIEQADDGTEIFVPSSPEYWGIDITGATKTEVDGDVLIELPE